MLERVRFCRLSELAASRQAVVLGDGDGRFTAKLLATAPCLQVHAVDTSPEMLRLLTARAGIYGARLTTGCADLTDPLQLRRAFTAQPAQSVDLVATHFFLDCLTGPQIRALLATLEPVLQDGALWVISEFAIPARRGLCRAGSRLLVRSLYAVFGLLTGLGVRCLPDHATQLRSSGLVLACRQSWLGGLLVSELWQYNRAPRRSFPSA